MANFFYFDQTGQRQGPLNESQVKQLAMQGIIRPSTSIETDTGRKGTAGQIPGLFPVEPNPFVIAPRSSVQSGIVTLTKTTVDYCDFIHPEDEIALNRLKAVPGLQTVTKWMMSNLTETFFHGLYMATRIRLSPTQLPKIYNLLPPICRKFGIEEPEFYLEMNPAPNAYTFGDTRTFLTITSGLLSHVKNDEELIAVLAHECGHILCRHVLYKTMAHFIADVITSIGMVGKLAMPIKYALRYWSRRSEYSADRAELVYLGDSIPVLGVLTRLAGGPAEITGNINFEEYADQAKYYLDLQNDSRRHQLFQTLAVMDSSHPFSSVRAHEILKWEKSEQYQRLRVALNKNDNRL